MHSKQPGKTDVNLTFMEYEITFTENPHEDDLRVLHDSYVAFTEAQIGKEDRRKIACFLRDENGRVVGGVQGGFGNYGWLWVGLLWVSGELRGKGYGSQLMARIESEAEKSGCSDVYLNSFSFQGVEFYKKIGYRVFGEMKDFPPGHSVFSLTKKLG